MSAALWITFVIAQASLWVIYNYRYDDLPEWMAKTLLAVFMISIVSFLYMSIDKIVRMQDVGTNGETGIITEVDHGSMYASNRGSVIAVGQHSRRTAAD